MRIRHLGDRGRAVRDRATAALAGAALLGALVAAPVAAAPSTKWFTLAASPSSIGAGATATFTVTLTNSSASSQSIGSANIVPPAGLTTVSASVATSPWTVDVGASGVIGLRNPSGSILAPGSSVSISVTESAACGGTGGAWDATVKQSNNFNGGGNDFRLLAGASLPQTTVVGTCRLAFVTQPADAAAGATISDSAFDATGGPVIVEAEDGTGARLTDYSGTIRMAIASGPSTSLSGTTSVAAVAGQASFDDLSIATTGTYSLRASATGFSSATSGSFVIASSGVVCEAGEACSDTASNGNTRTEVHAEAGGAGTLAITLSSLSGSGECSGYTGHGSVSTVDLTTGAASTVDLTLVRAISGNQGVSSFEVCFSSDAAFTDLFGNTVAPGAFGLLPDCSGPNPVAPCVVSKTRSPQARNDVLIVFNVPPGDPQFHA